MSPGVTHGLKAHGTIDDATCISTTWMFAQPLSKEKAPSDFALVDHT